MVRDKAIDQRQGHVRQLQTGIEGALSHLVVGAGVIAIILAFVMKNVMNALLIVTVLMLIICVVSLVYAHKIYVQEVNSGKDRD